MQRVWQFRRPIILSKFKYWSHLLLLFYFIFFPIVNSSEKVSLVIPIIAYFVAASIFMAIQIGSTAYFRNVDKAKLLITFMILIFFLYGRIFEIWPGIQIGQRVIGRNKTMLVIVLIAFLVIVTWLKNTSSQVATALNKATLTIIAILILSLPLIAKIQIHRSPNGTSLNLVSQRTQRSLLSSNSTVDTLPNLHNIYYIVLDSYLDGNGLKKYYNYDNSWFIGGLKQMGFSISHDSYSNYPFTVLSMASTLNMEYIHNGYYQPGIEINVRSAFDALNNNRVFDVVASKGYKINTRVGWANILQFSKSNDPIKLNDLFANEYFMILVRTSMLRVIEREMLSKSLREQTIDTLNELGKARFSNDSFFVYAHINPPHPPYIFKKDGTAPTLITSLFGRLENRSGYTEQVAFISHAVLNTIDQILENDHSDPVIIIHADHGHGYVLGDQLLSEVKPNSQFLHAQMGILLATRYPTSVKNSCYPGESPVNLYRTIFNDLFDSKYELLPAKHYFTHINEPWNFIDVTTELEYTTR